MCIDFLWVIIKLFNVLFYHYDFHSVDFCEKKKITKWIITIFFLWYYWFWWHCWPSPRVLKHVITISVVQRKWENVGRDVKHYTYFVNRRMIWLLKRFSCVRWPGPDVITIVKSKRSLRLNLFLQSGCSWGKKWENYGEIRSCRNLCLDSLWEAVLSNSLLLTTW